MHQNGRQFWGGDGMDPHGALDHSEKEFSIIDTIQPCVQLRCAVLEDLDKDKK